MSMLTQHNCFDSQVTNSNLPLHGMCLASGSRVHWDHYQAWHVHSAHSSRQPSLNRIRRQRVQVPVVYQCVYALPPRAPKIWTSRLWQAPDSVVKGVSRTRLPHGHGRAMQPSIRTLAPTRRAERIVAMLLQTLWFHYRAFLYQ